MKKLFSTSHRRLPAAILAVAVGISAALAEQVTVNGLVFNLTTADDGTHTAELVKGDANSVAVGLPTTLTVDNVDYQLTAIGDKAFQSYTNLESVSLPTGLKSIGQYAFDGCTALKKVNLPEGLETIGRSAFNTCTSLTAADIPGSVKNLGDYAFNRCSALAVLTLHEGLQTIGSTAFYRCSALTTLTLPSSVTSIGSSAFGSCSGLKTVELNEGLTKIGSAVFQSCSQLTEITVPSSVNTLGASTFARCTSLENVYIKGSINSLESYTFQICTSLQTVVLCKSDIDIYYDAFSGSQPKNVILMGTPASFIYGPGVPPNAAEALGNPANIFVPIEMYNRYMSNSDWRSAPVKQFFIAVSPRVVESLKVGETSQLTASYIANDADDASATAALDKLQSFGFVWSTDNAGVATVSSDGLVTAIAEGRCDITATSPFNSNSSGWASITVGAAETPEPVVLSVALPNGVVNFPGAATSETALTIKPDEGWKISTATLGGDDITSSLGEDGAYTVPVLTESKTLSVVFVKKTSTGVESAGNDEVAPHVYAANGEVRVEGATAGAEVKVYDLSGRCILTTRDHTFSTTARGVLLLTVENHTYKFAL